MSDLPAGPVLCMLSVISIKCSKYHLDNIKGCLQFLRHKDERKAHESVPFDIIREQSNHEALPEEYFRLQCSLLRMLTSINDKGYTSVLLPRQVMKVIIRNETVALGSERHPEFRGGIERGLRTLEYEIHCLQDVMSS